MADRAVVAPPVDRRTEAAALAELVLCENLSQTSGWAARWSARISGADGALLWVPHSVDPALLCIATAGEGTEQALRRSIPRDEGLASELLRDRAVVVFDGDAISASHDPLLHSLPSGIRQCVAIPLDVDRFAVGLLLLLFHTPRKLHDDADQLNAFIHHASPALARALRAERKTIGMLHAIERLTNLYDLSKAFTSTIDIQGLSRTIVNKAVDFAAAETASLWILESGAPVLKATGVNERFDVAEPSEPAGESLAREAVAGGTSIVRGSWLAVPLIDGETTIGALVMGNKRGKRDTFTTADEELLSDLARQAARAFQVAVERAQATEVRVESERLEEGLRLASEIQMRMLPSGNPPLESDTPFSIHAVVRPAKQVGGDLYDFFRTDDRLCFFIGDVAGKGIGAALVMAVTQTLFRAHAPLHDDPASLLSAINVRLYEQTDTTMFVTAFCGFLDLHNGRVRFSNAGHDRPLLISAGNPLRPLESKSGLPLGVLPKFHYAVEEVALEPGDAVLLYTDGVTEATNRDEELFSLERLRGALESRGSHDPSALIGAALEAVDRFAGGTAQSDDITMLSILYRGAGVSMTFRRDVEELQNVFAFLKSFDFVARFRPPIDLAVEEIFTNFVKHNPDGAGGIEIRVHRQGGDVSIALTDRDASPFEIAADPDINLPLEKRVPGGLGVYLTRKMMDRVEYAHDKRVATVTLHKRME